MSDPIVIRSYEPHDIFRITEIQAEAVLNGYGNFDVVPQSTEAMTVKFEQLTRNGYPIIVGEQHSEVCGYAYAGPYRDRPGYRWTVENSVYVDASCRNTGIGGLLLLELINRCKALGFRQMIAIIGDSENLGSINLHRKFDFTHTGTMQKVGFKLGRWLDVVIMQLSLSEMSDSQPDEFAYPGNLFKLD